MVCLRHEKENGQGREQSRGGNTRESRAAAKALSHETRQRGAEGGANSGRRSNDALG